MEIKLEDLHRHEGMPFFSLRENILLAKFRSTFSLTASMKMTRLAYIFLTAEHRVMSSFAFSPPLKEMTSGRWRTGPRRSIGNRAQWLIGYCFFLNLSINHARGQEKGWRRDIVSWQIQSNLRATPFVTLLRTSNNMVVYKEEGLDDVVGCHLSRPAQRERLSRIWRITFHITKYESKNSLTFYGRNFLMATNSTFPFHIWRSKWSRPYICTIKVLRKLLR